MAPGWVTNERQRERKRHNAGFPDPIWGGLGWLMNNIAERNTNNGNGADPRDRALELLGAAADTMMLNGPSNMRAKDEAIVALARLALVACPNDMEVYKQVRAVINCVGAAGLA